jgi:hypothetical protein
MGIPSYVAARKALALRHVKQCGVRDDSGGANLAARRKHDILVGPTCFHHFFENVKIVTQQPIFVFILLSHLGLGAFGAEIAGQV